jgi:hypothetical protein
LVGDVSDHELKPLRLIGVALLGAVTMEIILVFSTGLTGAFTVRQIPSHLAALAVGALGGWIYELFRQLHETTRTSLQELATLMTSVEGLTNKISYQDKALSMLVGCPRHNEALTALITASMSDNFKNIPFVGVADYLRFLAKAIQHSDGYHGVHRQPLRWYRERGAGGYLDDLRERQMKYKVRLIVLDEEDVVHMDEDLRDQELLDYYWRHTGDVETYWISAREFEKSFPGTPVPRDFALYDRTLLIAYDETRQILSFDIVAAHRPERRIFEMQRELTLHNSPILRKVPSVAQEGPGAVGAVPASK